jgi:phage gp46-like protein
MEVHHHAHTERKKWTHYFWEFLMLFLAVFCGFLAENQREHMIEHKREKEYMRSLIEDLQTDTSNLNSNMLLGQVVRTRLENLISFLNNETSKDSAVQLYKLNNQVGRVVNVNFEDRTSSQLKNGGNMRLIRNKAVADSIRSYWGDIKTMEDISSRLDDLRSKAVDIQAQIFYNKYIKLSDTLDPIHSDILISPGAKLIDNDPELLALYSNRRQFTLTVLTNYIRGMKYVKSKAINLVTFIRKGYHIE